MMMIIKTPQDHIYKTIFFKQTVANSFRDLRVKFPIQAAGEVAQCSGAPPALPNDLGSILKTHMAVHNLL